MADFPKEKVLEAYYNAPDAVRRAFSSQDTINLIRDIRKRYNLHVDAAGTLGEDIGYMLIGLMNPAEFFGNLVLSGVDETTARQVLEAVNTRIFVPVRNEVRNPKSSQMESRPDIESAEASSDSVRPPFEATSAQPAQRIPDEAQEAPEAMPPISLTLPGSTERVPIPRATEQPMRAPQATPELSSNSVATIPAMPLAKSPATAASAAAQPQSFSASMPQEDAPHITRTMAHDMDALKHGQDPAEVAHPGSTAWSPSAEQVPPIPPAPEKPRVTQPALSVRPQFPTISEPGLSSPVFRPHTFSTQPANQSAPYPLAAPAATDQISKEYGADPYREPI